MLTFKQFRLRLDEIVNSLDESFYIFRTDTNAILARGLPDYESAKTRSNLIRKQLGLKWDQVSFRSEKKPVAPIKKKPTFMKSPFIKYGSGYADQNGGGSKIRTTYKDFDEQKFFS